MSDPTTGRPMNIDLISEIVLRYHAKRNLERKPFADYLEIIRARGNVLKRFQPFLNNPDNLEASMFRDFLDHKHNQHWTGLQRPTKHVCDDMPKLRKALTHLFDEELPIDERLDDLTGDGDLSISGLSFGILTPLLLVRFPDRYGVWNGKSEGALKAMKMWPAFERGMSGGMKYRQLSDIFLGVSKSTGLDLWTLDGVWHVINEESKIEAVDALGAQQEVEKDYHEGKRIENKGIRIERDLKARDACIAKHGHDCAVCGFNFFVFYGDLGMNYIHVHHREDLSDGERATKLRHLIVGFGPATRPNCSDTKNGFSWI